MYAGCVLLRQVSPTWFHLEYDAMLRMGEQKLTVPIGYTQFTQIFNAAPGVPVNFVYISGNETLMGSGPKPDREVFKVSPRDLYSARQVAPRGSQFLSPSRAGIMTQMLWRNAENASRSRRNGPNSYEDDFGNRASAWEKTALQRSRVSALSRGVCGTPPNDQTTFPDPISTSLSAQDQVMKDTISGNVSNAKAAGVSAKGKGRKKD